MTTSYIREIAVLAAGADGNCPCNCHNPEVCKVSEPFGHHDCVECWIALIEEICSKGAEPYEKAIWAVLVAVCGVDPDGLDDFVHNVRDSRMPEYRFQGSLGFGGKVYIENPPRVECYKENETTERLRTINSANELLAIIAKLY